MPQLPRGLHGYIKYDLHSSGGEKVIRLFPGTSVCLPDENPESGAVWVLYGRNLSLEEVITEDRVVKVRG